MLFMKNFYIISFGVSLLFLTHIIYKAGLENSLWYEMYYEWESNGYSSSSYDELYSMSHRSSLISIPFIIFYVLLFSFSFKSIKTSTAKVMNILGVSISGLVFLITLLPVLDLGKISFEELSYLLVPYALAVGAFTIVNFIQLKRENDAYNKSNQFTVDDID